MDAKDMHCGFEGCSKKLGLMEKTIGKCKCSHVYCTMHRLPEHHSCDYNFKEHQKVELKEKLVVPKSAKISPI